MPSKPSSQEKANHTMFTLNVKTSLFSIVFLKFEQRDPLEIQSKTNSRLGLIEIGAAIKKSKKVIF